MKKPEILFGILKIPVDFIMTSLAIILAYKLRIVTASFTSPIVDGTLPTFIEQFLFSLKSAALLVFIFALSKNYKLSKGKKFTSESGKVFALWIVWVMAIISYYFYIRNFPFSRLAIVYGWILTLFLVTFGRILIFSIQRFVNKLGIGKTNLLFIGNNKITEELSEQFKKDVRYNIVGIIGEKTTKSKYKLLGNLSQLEYIIKKQKIDEVIQTKPLSTDSKNSEILRLCDLFHVAYRFVPNLMEVRRTNIEIDTYQTIPVISLRPTPLDGWGKVYKRAFDIFGSTFGLILLSPIMLITAIAIKIDSKGQILFTKLDNGQPVKRIGRHGQPFKFYKFRSMKSNTDTLRYTELADKNIRADGPLVKIQNDPRITKVGKFIRKTSIDELPQLFSVFIGTMSLVGPRPHLPEEVKKYTDDNRFVFTIKPGITGLPQVSGRSDLNFEEEIRLDRYYIENWSIMLDIKIIFKTIFTILKPFKE